MNTTVTQVKIFSESDKHNFEPMMKVGILGTVMPDGLPHLTVISTFLVAGEQQLCWGQFIDGTSKAYIRQNPKTGWLVMNMNKEVWRGKASFTHTTPDGADFDFMNNTTMFRYNAYFGIHTVYYMDLIGQTGKTKLPMGGIIWGSIHTLLAAKIRKKAVRLDAMNALTRGLISGIGNLKFLGFVDEDGYPVVIPVLQATTASPDTIYFSFDTYTDELAAIPPNTPVALMGMTLQMQDVLVRGMYEGRNGSLGKVKVDWVYNSMPPAPQQIYPPLPLEAVRVFE